MAPGKATYVPDIVITTQREQDSCLIELAGDLDFGGSLLLDETIKKALQDGQHLTKIYVNCKDLHFISSAGLGVLVENLHLVQAHGVALILYAMNYMVKDVFTILGLDTFFSIVASKEEANAVCLSQAMVPGEKK